MGDILWEHLEILQKGRCQSWGITVEPGLYHPRNTFLDYPHHLLKFLLFMSLSSLIVLYNVDPTHFHFSVS
jgi:hypothetical protein